MTDEFLARLEAVERAVTDGETDFTAAADAATVEQRLTTVETRLTTLEDRLADLDATTQALRGYLSGVDGVTEDVERQAALALAKAEAVEAHVFDAKGGLAVERLQRPDAAASRGETNGAPADNRITRTEHTTSGRDSHGQEPSSAPVADCRVADSDEPVSSLVTRLRNAL